MKTFGDEAGLFWNQPIKVGRTAAGGAVVVKEPLRRPPPPADYKLPTEFPQFSRYKRIGLDIETKDPHLKSKGCGAIRKDGFLVGVGVRSDEWTGDYYPVGHVNAPNCDPEKVYRWLRDELRDYTGEIIGANLLYEGEWLENYDITFKKAKIRDVQWAEPLLNENAISYKLKFLAMKYLGLDKVTEELEELYGPAYIENMDKVHPGHAKAYVMGDITLPMLVIDKQMEELEKENLVELFHLESRLYHMLTYMKRRGVRIDLAAAEKLGVTLAAKKKAEAEQIRYLVGRDVDCWSASSIATAFDKLGINYPRTEATPKKPEGSPSFRQAWLAAHEAPIAQHIMNFRKYDKFKGTFVDAFLESHVNGRIHCTFNPLRKDDGGTVSGRFSSTNPNLQQVPIRDEVLGPLIRGLFIPDDGRQWWSKDFSQIEYRFLVHYAVLARCRGAEVAANRYRNDPKTDFHVYASEITGLHRKKAKNVNFGIVYGMGQETMAFNMGVTEEEAAPMLEQYHTEMPFCKEVYKMASNRAGEAGYVRTVLNRKRRFDLWEPFYTPQAEGVKRPPALPYKEARLKYGDRIKRAFTHKALNSVLQGSSADLTKKSMVDIWEAGLTGPGAPLDTGLTVHDELDGDCDFSPRSDEALREAHEIMVNAIPLKVPVLVDSKTGKNWAEAH